MRRKINELKTELSGMMPNAPAAPVSAASDLRITATLLVFILNFSETMTNTLCMFDLANW